MFNNKGLALFSSIFLAALLVAQNSSGNAPDALQGNLWQHISANTSIAVHNNRRVDAERQWYLQNPDYLRRVSARAEPYLFYVVEELERRQLPLELALLPIMESAYDPFAYSHGRAAGLWQIIPGTAGDLGLDQDWWYDARRDVRASTHAALDYLEKINANFDGDWLKTLAAYNAGQRRVKEAVASAQKAGRGTDFWALKLPLETRNYVPRFLALTDLVSRIDHYGINLTPVLNQPYFAVVDTQGQLDLSQAAQLAGMDINEIYRLNPGFSRWATKPAGPHELLLPLEYEPGFTAALGQLDPAHRVQWNRHQVVSGDSLIRIAKRYNTGVDVIRQVNGLRGNSIRAGDTLLIPTALANPEQYTLSAGQRLASRQKTGSGVREVYRVQSGDSFWSIAQAHGVSVRKLAEWNGKARRDPIFPGEELVIWRAASITDTATLNTPMRSPMVRKLGYRVRSGDSLARIAGKFNITVEDIVGWNQQLQTKKYIHPGDRLTLFVDVTGG